jgi:predicted transcriptional regulator
MMTEENVREMVNEMLDDMNQKELADRLGVSVSYLNDYLHFRRKPGAKILDALGLKRVVRYVRKDAQGQFA